ncbi:MAG: hypothetical protein DRP56_05285 [Planctomycetota bacterium]|nr:MAG: hypothetical protein DRP56_05285 [Planctomycetota bacterium]
MGAFGSGDWADAMTRKVNTDLCRTLSIRTLKKMGVFDDDSSDEVFSVRWVNELGEDAGSVSIIPQVCVGGNGNKRSLRVEMAGCVTGGGSSVTGQDISITTTPCYYGGVRYWFLCPAVVDGVLCEDRASKLYLPPGGELFGCRQCYGLTYESCQQSHKYDRVFDHLDRLDEDNLTINQVLRLGGL